ncbi:MAG: lysophospholipid acyltransferase family protein [Halioglobus sp.]|nr:lysophospholipid acyltransferase family protein [Halioglobus sp.]
MLKLLGAIPASRRDAFTTLLYVLLYRIAGYRKDIVTENLKSVFEDENAKELTVRAQNFYRHIATLLLEISRTQRMDAQAFRQHVRVNNPELVAQTSAGYTRPILILSLHQGNWEWLLSGVAVALGQPLHVVYKPLHNAALDTHMHRLRERFDCRPVAVADLGRDLVAARRAPRLLVMAADQAPVGTERQQTCDFLGRATAFHALPGELAVRFGMPVLFARCHRDSPAGYCVDFEVIADGTAALDGSLITDRYAALAEAAILAQPHTWLWSHRRWKPS